MLAFLASLVLVCEGLCAQIPAWYASHKDPRFPDESYIIGVGEGSGPHATDDAKKAAQTDLVSQIRVQIQAEARGVSESYRFNKDEQMYSEFRSRVRTSVSDEITGMQVVETVTDNSTRSIYALVALEREKYCQTLGADLDAGWKQANALKIASVDESRKGKLNEAVQELMTARKTVASLLPKQALYNTVSHTPYKSPFDFGPVTLSSDISAMLSDVRFEKISGDRQNGSVGMEFPQPFGVRVTIHRDSTSIPVVGSTVVFEATDNVKLGEATTDEHGEARFSTTIRQMKGNTLRARLTLGASDREFKVTLMASAVSFTWKTESAGVSFTLKVEVPSKKAFRDLTRIVTSSLTQIGYKTARSSRYVLQVTTETSQSNAIEGMAGTMYSVTLGVRARLIDSESDRTLGEATFSGKGLGESESAAVDKAAAKVRIDTNELADLLAKALQK